MMDLEMTFQLARDLMAADSIEMIQRETVASSKPVWDNLRPSRSKKRRSYCVVASEDLDAQAVTERLRNCVNGNPRFDYASTKWWCCELPARLDDHRLSVRSRARSLDDELYPRRLPLKL